MSRVKSKRKQTTSRAFDERKFKSRVGEALSKHQPKCLSVTVDTH